MLKAVIIFLFLAGIIFSGEDVAWSDSFTLSDNTAISRQERKGRIGPDLVITKNGFIHVISLSFTDMVRPFSVTVEIFNVKGKLVETLKAGSKRAVTGIEWDASLQPSGLYLISVSHSNKSCTHRMMLVK